MYPEAVRIPAARLYHHAGNDVETLARILRTDPGQVAQQLSGERDGHLPGAAPPGVAREPLLHRGRLLLRDLLDHTDRSAGPDRCWPTTGWRQQGRAARHCSLLGTSSKPRALLQLTSPTFDAPRELVAAHACGNGAGDIACCNPAHLVGWDAGVDHATNMSHRRLHRLQLPIEGRAWDEIANMDVLLHTGLDVLRILAALERALSRVVRASNGECLITAGTERNTWYGQTLVLGQTVKRHRWTLQLLGVELGQAIVQHACSTPPCWAAINHLSPGTHSSNALHAVATGRAAAGQRHPRALYENADIVVMRRTSSPDPVELQRRFGGTRQTVVSALTGRTYGSVGGPRHQLVAKRRLSPLGVRTVRALRAVGMPEPYLAALFELSSDYLRDLAAGKQRPACGGVFTAAPGHATGRDVAQGVLGPADHAWISRRQAQGTGTAQIARELGVNPSSVTRAHQRQAGRHDASGPEMPPGPIS